MILDDSEISGAALNADEAFSLLQELGRNTTDEIRRQRAHFRITVKTGVVLTPGNASEKLSMKVKGVTGDVSEGGCSGLFPVPPRVGDIYRLQFDREKLDLPLTFARCVRCRLVREDAFEAGFAFFKSICLPERVMQGQGAGAVLEL